MNRFARFGIAVLAAAALSMGAACSTINSLAGGDDGPSVSPREAVLEAANKVEPAIKEVTVLLAAGVVSKSVAADIAEYGPAVQRIGAAYFDEARVCLVTDGQLATDPETGGDCAPSTLRSIYNAFDGELTAWMIEASRKGDQQTAGYIAAARLIATLVPEPVSAGPFPGYRPGPDVPVALFDARREAVSKSFSAMIEAARIQAGLEGDRAS